MGANNILQAKEFLANPEAFAVAAAPVAAEESAPVAAAAEETKEEEEESDDDMASLLPPYHVPLTTCLIYFSVPGLRVVRLRGWYPYRDLRSMCCIDILFIPNRFTFSLKLH